MAEIAGLVLGAVSVVSLVGAFKECVDLFSYISASRSLGRDYELLDTKLDVEKTLLLQWAERVQLLKYGAYDKRLDQPTISMTISRMLASMRLLLSESNNLQQRYGMNPTEKNEMMDVGPTISGLRMARFVREFEDLSLRIKGRQEHVPLFGKVRWVVHDKEKFNELIQQLSYFISKLNDIVPDLGECIPSMTREDLEDLRSVKRLHLVLQASIGHEDNVAKLAKQTITENCQRRILQCIWYRTIDDRRDQVKTAHYNTFRWSLEPPRDEFEWDDLPQWLRSGSGIYWLSGKAGSGKSTLMKYLCCHDRTKTLLEEWAADHPLILASFFFWNLGTTEQKSLEGLSRGLLCHIMNSDPSLIPKLLPNMWRDAQGSDQIPALPSPTEMQEAFQRIADGQRITQKFCFFIDGLDEYSGNNLNGITFISGLVASANIKVVVSSRPIPTCVQAFSTRPKLHLQDLTRDDIMAYVDDTIGSQPYMKTLSEPDSTSASKILIELVDKASGVFLWVVLACRSLLEGFAAFDSISELQDRIDELPPELEDLFQHMLNKIEPRYQEQAAKFLRICYQKRVVSANKKIPTIGLAIANDYGLDLSRIPEPRELSRDEKRAKCHVLEGRLRSRCCGLLEIHRSYGLCFCQNGQDPRGPSLHDSLIDSTIEFMHRSIFEFLSIPGIWDLNCLQVRDQLFEPSAMLACLSLHLAQICSTGHKHQYAQGNHHVEESLLYGTYADEASPDSMLHVLPKFDAVIAKLFAGAQHNNRYLHSELGTNMECSDITQMLALEAGLINFVQAQQLSGRWTFTPQQMSSLLFQAVVRPILSSMRIRSLSISSKMIQYLISLDCDPNKTVTTYDSSGYPQTPWLRWLQEMRVEKTESASSFVVITKIFIDGGADIRAADLRSDLPLETLILQNVDRCTDCSSLEVKRMVDNLLRVIESRRNLPHQVTPASRPSSLEPGPDAKRSHSPDGQWNIGSSKKPRRHERGTL